MAGRCGVLCQHPGCWYSGSKVYDKNKRRCPGYSRYIDYIRAKKEAENFHSTPKTSDGGVIDGLPYLTVFDMSSDGITSSRHLSSSTQENHLLPLINNEMAALLPYNKDMATGDDQLKSSSMRFSLDTPLYADRGRSPSPPPPEYDEYWFTPVLVWQPGKKQQKSKYSASGEKEKKNDKILKTTNLDVNCLPNIPDAATKEKRQVGKMDRRSKSVKLSMDEYIMEGLRDVPPHIVDEIIQELHSQSCTDVQEKALGKPDKATTTTATHTRGSPPTYMSYLPPSSKLYPRDSTIPSSVMLNLQSKRIQRTASKERRSARKRTNNNSTKSPHPKTSYSRVLASQPQTALSGLKIRVAKLQTEDDRYYLLNKPTAVDDWTDEELMVGSGSTHPRQHQEFPISRFPGSDERLLQQSSSIQSGPSFFAARSLSKAMLQRLNYRTTPSNRSFIPAFPGELNLSLPIGKSLMLSQSLNDSSTIPYRPSIHIPLLPIQDRLYSEERSTIPGSCQEPDSRAGSCQEPDSRTDSRSAAHSGTDALSRMSSDRMIISADHRIGGELVLLNKSGEVVHHIQQESENEADIIVPFDATEKDEGAGESSSSESLLLAPPPTARQEDSSALTQVTSGTNNDKESEKSP